MLSAPSTLAKLLLLLLLLLLLIKLGHVQIAFGATPVLYILSPTQKLLRTALSVVSPHNCDPLTA